MDIRARGASQLAASLDQAARELADMRTVHAAAARLVATAAASRAPRRTGRLAGSIAAHGDAGKAVITYGSPSVPYGGVVHWGWPAHGIRANPFASNAAVATEPQWTQLYADGVQHVLDAVHGI